jgi:hypothetical protein
LYQKTNIGNPYRTAISELNCTIKVADLKVSPEIITQC